MNLYADASAVLAWLLREARAEEASSLLSGAQLVLSSQLTLVECDRALHRLTAEGSFHDGVRAELAGRVAAAATTWTQLAITDSILNRARLPFQGGPVRTLDAIHLASALEGRATAVDLAVLSLDDRMRRAARALGFEVHPA